ncbi:hypothetical protein NC651_020788 [Populus alba x Populus x berolinensis]|nr:hypothetical protein NC651_020788 [Populus alba x Populus x berolinensis]
MESSHCQELTLQEHAEDWQGAHFFYHIASFLLLGTFSIWLDSKMRLNHDPMLIIEYFLWRTRSEYAISNHYDRHYVWEETCLKVRLLSGPIQQCQIYFNAPGLMKLIDLIHENIESQSTILPKYVLSECDNILPNNSTSILVIFDKKGNGLCSSAQLKNLGERGIGIATEASANALAIMWKARYLVL